MPQAISFTVAKYILVSFLTFESIDHERKNQPRLWNDMQEFYFELDFYLDFFSLSSLPFFIWSFFFSFPILSFPMVQNFKNRKNVRFIHVLREQEHEKILMKAAFYGLLYGIRRTQKIE